MNDCELHIPIKVRTDGDAGPYLLVPEQQVKEVGAVLKRHGIPSWTDLGAVSLDDAPAYATINFGRGVDVDYVQRVLDEVPQPQDEAEHVAKG